MKKLILVPLLLLVMLLSACSEEAEQTVNDITSKVQDQASNVANMNNEHVLSVKDGEFEKYPGIKIGDAFSSFFGEPTWKYFEADSGEDVVEFTGYLTYQDTKVKGRLQFILNEDDTFEVGALSFNDVPQTELVKGSLLSKVFEPDNEEQQ